MTFIGDFVPTKANCGTTQLEGCPSSDWKALTKILMSLAKDEYRDFMIDEDETGLVN